MFSDRWSSSVKVPFGEEWGNGVGGVAGCLTWHAPQSHKCNNSMSRSDPKPLRSSLRSSVPPMRQDDTSFHDDYKMRYVNVLNQDGSLSTRYIPTPPITQRSHDGGHGSHLDSHRSHLGSHRSHLDTHRSYHGDTVRTRDNFRYYTPSHPEQPGIYGDTLKPHPPASYHVDTYRGDKVRVADDSIRRHGYKTLTTRDIYLLSTSREDYERSLREGFRRDRELERKLYGYNPRELEYMHPGSAAGMYTDRYSGDRHVSWGPDIPVTNRSRPSTAAAVARRTDRYHLADTKYPQDIYDSNGQMRSRSTDTRDQYGYWHMNKFIKNAKPKVSTWRGASDTDSLGKVNMLLDCPEDSDMVVSVRLRSAK